MRSGVPCHVAVVRRAPPPLVSVRHAQHTRRGAQISGTSGGCTRGPGGRGLGTSKPWLLRDSKVSSLVPQSCSSVKPLHTPHALRGFAVCTGGHACIRKASRHDKLDSGCKAPGAVKRAASSTAFAMRAPMCFNCAPACQHAAIHRQSTRSAQPSAKRHTLAPCVDSSHPRQCAAPACPKARGAQAAYSLGSSAALRAAGGAPNSRRRAVTALPCWSQGQGEGVGTLRVSWHVKSLPRPAGRRGTKSRKSPEVGSHTLHCTRTTREAQHPARLPCLRPYLFRTASSASAAGSCAAPPRCAVRVDGSTAPQSPSRHAWAAWLLADAAPAARAGGVRPGLTAGMAPAAP